MGSFLIRPHVNSETKILLSPPKYLEFFVFGHSEVVADYLWIRAIQDFDYCEELVATQRCKDNGWLYQMLDSITNLSPRFRIPYATGGLALTVIVSDYAGASKFFDKAVIAFPTDWPILYRAAYHALYEEKNNLKAAKLLEAAAKNGGLPWMYSLASRLYTEGGQKELGLRLYNELKSDPNTDPGILKRMREKLGLPD